MVVAPCGAGWAQHAEIGMTINLPGHPMALTQCYLAMKDTIYRCKCNFPFSYALISGAPPSDSLAYGGRVFDFRSLTSKPEGFAKAPSKTDEKSVLVFCFDPPPPQRERLATAPRKTPPPPPLHFYCRRPACKYCLRIMIWFTNFCCLI